MPGTVQDLSRKLLNAIDSEGNVSVPHLSHSLLSSLSVSVSLSLPLPMHQSMIFSPKLYVHVHVRTSICTWHHMYMKYAY